MKDCIFCKIAEGKIPCHKVYEDEEFLAFLDINPNTRGMTLVIPKKQSIVNIETWPIEKEKKSDLIKKITDVFIEMGIPAQAVTVIIHETELDNWGSGGEQHAVKFKDLKKSL